MRIFRQSRDKEMYKLTNKILFSFTLVAFCAALVFGGSANASSASHTQLLRNDVLESAALNKEFQPLNSSKKFTMDNQKN